MKTWKPNIDKQTSLVSIPFLSALVAWHFKMHYRTFWVVIPLKIVDKSPKPIYEFQFGGLSLCCIEWNYNVDKEGKNTIGRKRGIETLLRLYNSQESQFVAIYGRRRIGKTHLVNEVFQNKNTFKHPGVSPIEMNDADIKSPLKFQLKNFYNSLILSGMKPQKYPNDWMEAFLMLELFLQKIDDGSRQLLYR